MFTASIRPATNGNDFFGDSVVLEFNPSNVGEQHCLTISVLEDTIYEGEELFGFEIYKAESLEVSIPRPRSAVRIMDNDGMCFCQHNFMKLCPGMHFWVL